MLKMNFQSNLTLSEFTFLKQYQKILLKLFMLQFWKEDEKIKFVTHVDDVGDDVR